MKLSARIASAFFIVVVSFFSIVPSFAQAQVTNPYAPLMKTDNSVSVNISTITQGVFLGMLSSVTCLLGGVDFMTPTHACLTYDSKTQTYSYAKEIGGGVLGLEAGGVALTYTSPFHTSDYIHYMADNFGLAKKADAANGIDQLNPIVSLWIAFRNISYLLFVIIFVVIGFAIMVRAKIDPRTVMTIENQLPKIITALILITFSFAIAGLAIDIMWVGVYLVINLFASLDPTLHSQLGVITSSVTSNPYGWVNTLNTGPLGFLGIAQQAAGGVKDIANVITFNFFQNAGFLKVFTMTILGAPMLISCFAAQFQAAVSNVPVLGGVINFLTGPATATGGPGQSVAQGAAQNFGACLDAGFATLISSLIGGIAFVIFAIAMIVAIARLWWSLIKSYTLFILFVVLGPLTIMAGVIPGAKVNFEYWIRHILAYLIVFPTAMAIFLLGKTLMDVYSNQSAFTPPLFGATAGVTNFMGPLLGFAVMMLAPQALHMVQDALNAPDPKYLAGVGQSIGVGSQAFGAGVGKLWDRSWRPADPIHGLAEGWARKLILPRGSFIRDIVIGKETGTNIKPNNLGGGGSH